MNTISTTILLLLMIAYAFLNGTGSYLVKIGLNRVTGLEISLHGLFRNIFRTLYQLIKVPLFICGFILAVIGFLIYQYAILLYDLSLVKPLQTLSILFILLWGLKYLKEHINLREVFGILVLLLGSILISIYVSEKSTVLNLNNLIIFSIISILLTTIVIIITIFKKDEKMDEYFFAIASALLFSLGMVFNNALYVFEIEEYGKFSLSLHLLFNPYLYLLVISYFFAGFIMLVAYFKGRLSLAASTIGFLTFGLPIFGAIFIFNENLFILFDGALIFPFSFFKLIGLILLFCGIFILYPRIKLPEKNSLRNSSRYQ